MLAHTKDQQGTKHGSELSEYAQYALTSKGSANHDQQI